MTPLRTLALLTALCLFPVGHVVGGEGQELLVKRSNPPDAPVQTLYFPDRRDLGTGTYHVEMTPEALVCGRTQAGIVSPPDFQIELAISVSRGTVMATLGRSDSNRPPSQGVFVLPPEFQQMRDHVYDLSFAEWKIEKLVVDGRPLDLLKDPA